MKKITLTLCFLLLSPSLMTSAQEVSQTEITTIPSVEIAKVNGESISVKTYQEALDKGVYQAALKKAVALDSPQGKKFLKQYKLRLLNDLIEITLIQQFAREKKITVSGLDIEKELARFIKQNLKGDKTVLENELRKQKISIVDYKKQIGKGLLIRKVFDALVKDIIVSDSDSQSYYHAHLKDFKQPLKIEAKHILIKPKSKDPKAIEAAREVAILMIQKYKRGTSFKELVKTYSEDSGSKNKGGSYTFPRGMMVLSFEKAAFALKEGEITSEPVKTQFGWHVILKGKTFPEGALPFEKVNALLKKKLLSLKKSEYANNWVKNAKEKAKVEYVEADVLALKRTL